MRTLSRDKGKNSHAKHAITLAAALAAAMFFAGCAAGGERDASEATQARTTPQTTSETTLETPAGEERMLEIRPIDSGSSGQGDAEPRAVIAASPESLSAALGPNLDLRIAEDTTGGGDEETYVAVFWGQKNTGGYAVEIESASLEGDRVIISVALRNPPEGAIVSQALTYPYAVAAIENLDPANKDFVLTDEIGGRELDWPVETV